jgi:hypothetical protein
MIKLFSAAVFLVLAGATTANAQTFTPLLTATVGSGSEETFLALDFKDGTQNDNYAFGYKYDGTKTGVDLLNALASNGLMTQYIYNGAAVNGFKFDGHSEAGFAASGYWAYYKSLDGQTWQYSSKGVTGSLTAGGWDGWSWAPNSKATPPITPAAVPEASSVVSLGLLLGLGVIALRRKKTMPA